MGVERNIFSNQTFDDTIREIVSDLLLEEDLQDIPLAVHWMKNVLDQNIHTGKKNRGRACVSYLQYFKKDYTEEDAKLAYVAGWCAEISQAAALMADDVMDGSETRRGDICWYKREEVGLSAINDAFMLENIVYQLLWKYFSHMPYFQRLFKRSNRQAFLTILGQCMDTRMSMTRDLDSCTLENYKRVVKYKTSIYSFYGPVQTAMTMAGITDDELDRSVEDVTLRIGHLFQVQDDYLDCYGNPEITGKIGTDIIDRKCTWLLVNALELATPEQRQVLENYYGSKCEGDEENIKRIYNDLDLKSKFHAFEVKTYKEIKEQIKILPSVLPQKPFVDMLAGIYGRKK